MAGDLEAQIAAWEEYYGLAKSSPLTPAEELPGLLALRSLVFTTRLTPRQYFEIQYQLLRLCSSIGGPCYPPELKKAQEVIGEKNLVASASFRREQESLRYRKEMEKTGDGSFRPLFKW